MRFAANFLLVSAVLLGLAGRAFAEPAALVVVGLTANESDAALWQRLARETRAGLIARGFPTDRVRTLGVASATGVSSATNAEAPAPPTNPPPTGAGSTTPPTTPTPAAASTPASTRPQPSPAAAPATRETFLAALASARAEVTAGDEFWLVLLGHSAPGRDGAPAFQLRGPRLAAADLRAALEPFPGTTTVLIATAQSRGFLDALQPLARCTAVAASDAPALPRFAEAWVEAFTAAPRAPFVELATTATTQIVRAYRRDSIAQGETAYALVNGTIAEIVPAPDAPPTQTVLAPAAPSPAPEADAATTLPESPNSGDATAEPAFDRQPATDATRALIAEAARLADQPLAGDHAALVLSQDIELTFNADLSRSETHRLRVRLRRPEAVDDWADFTFAHHPPRHLTTIVEARVILPDASVAALNLARFTAARNDASADATSREPRNASEPLHVHLPQATAGAIVEIAWRSEHRAAADLPQLSAETELAQSVPVVATTLTLRTPRGSPFRHQLRNLPDAPTPVESATEHSRVLTWTLPALPAHEPLPYDPPRRDVVPALAVSSFASWDDFAAWYRRLAGDSFAAGPATRAAAAAIAQKHAAPADRLRAAYTEVAALRYVALEIGIDGFRPRPPDTVLGNRYGDCKDKAVLLAALLRELGLAADFALVNRGSSTDTAFPGWQFNHALVHVPAGVTAKDAPEQWLDATDGTVPAGFVAPGNVGRAALVFPATGPTRFATITPPAGQATTIDDTWTFTEQPDRTWRGRVERRFTGLADNSQRARLRALSPQQRAFAVQQHLAQLLPGADFTSVIVTGLDDLAQPVAITADIALPASFAPAPRPAAEFAPAFAAATRDRPLVLNDGQPLRYTSRVTHIQHAPDPNSEVRATEKMMILAGPNHFTHGGGEPSAGVSTRIEELNLAAPVIAPADYVTFRRQFLYWREKAARVPTSVSPPTSTP